MAEKDQEKSEEEVPVEDEFGDAFDEAVAVDEGEEKVPIEEAEEPEEGAEEKPEKKEPEEEEPTSKDVKDETGEEEAGDEPGEEKPGSEEATTEGDEPEETIESLTQKYKTLQGMYNSEVKKNNGQGDKPDLEEEIGDVEEESGKEKEVKPAIDTSAILSEIAELDSFKNVKEEFGDDLANLVNDIATKLITITNQATSELSKEMTGRLGELSEVVNPLHTSHVKSEGNRHTTAIVEAHPDVQKIVESGDLRKWIEDQPAYKRKMYTEVYKDGATTDVIDLFSTFKKETGLAEEKPSEEKEEEKSEELEDTTKQEKLEDMEDVETKKTPVSESKGGASKNDYNGAWEEANT